MPRTHWNHPESDWLRIARHEEMMSRFLSGMAKVTYFCICSDGLQKIFS